MNGIQKLKKETAQDFQKKLSSALFAIGVVAYQYKGFGRNFSYNRDVMLRRRVDQILLELKNSLLLTTIAGISAISKLASEKHNKAYTPTKEEASLFVFEKIENETTESRIDRYVKQFEDESESYMLAGILAGISYEKMHNIFMANSGAPLKAALIVSILGADTSSYGKGNYAGSLPNLSRMAYDVLQRAYTRTEWLSFKAIGGFNGYRVFRNSSIPCEICDQYAGRIYSMSSMILPLHPRCICGAEPVLVNTNEIEKEA